MLHRMQIPAFFRLEKLGPDGKRRSIPPKPTKQISAACGLAYPAVRRQMECPLLEIKPVHPFFWNRLISLKTFLCRRATEMKIKRRRQVTNFRSYRRRQISYGVFYSPPWRRLGSIVVELF